MDLGAYSNIENIGKIMKENGISVPRLRGFRLMKNAQPISKEDMEKEIRFIWMYSCKEACESVPRFSENPTCTEISSRTMRLKKKYLIKSDGKYICPRWKNLHGKKRKLFKRNLKKATKLVENNYGTFNKYCGRDDVLYIHARIGGQNWAYYGGGEIARQPWFLEKVDDPFDNTYCDVYAKIEVR